MKVLSRGKGSLSEEANKRRSKSQMGERNSNWRGGVSKDKAYRNKQQIRWRHETGRSKLRSRGRVRTKSSAEYMRLWRKNNPIKARIQRKAYKYNKKAAGELLLHTIQRVYEENIKTFGTLTCIYCFSLIQFGSDTLEHIIPLSRGGTNVYENLGIACRKCNIGKNNKLLKEWVKQREEE